MSKLLLRPWPFPVILALRYLRSTRRDAFASFLSLVAAGGLALGVMALILSLAVISGFQSALRSELLGRTPQIEVELPPGSPADVEAAREAVSKVPGVVSAQVQVSGGGWLVSEGKVRAVELVGFEGQVPRSFPGAAGKPAGLYVPASLATRWGLTEVKKDQTVALVSPPPIVELVSPRPTLSPFGPQPRVRSVPVTGIYETGRTQEERDRVALPLDVARTLLGSSEMRLEVTARGLDEALEVAGRLPAVLPAESGVRTWQDLNRPLLFALRLEKVLMFVAVSLIILVAALALVADLALIISSKRPEIGMLGTMGATPAALGQAFVILGGLVAGSGIVTGAVLGVGASWVLDHYQLVPVPGRVYFLDYVPFLVQPGDLVLVLLVTLLLALASSLYAAKRAAALDPVEAFRR